MNRLATSFLFVPLLISILVGLENGQLSGAYVTSTQMALVALVVTFAHFILLGLPAFVLSVKLKNLEWWVAAIAGTLGSQAIPLILLLRGFGSLRFSVYFGGWGLFGALLFWWLAIGSNADAPYVKNRSPLSAMLLMAAGLVAVPISYKIRH